jgi:hypothetical protein
MHRRRAKFLVQEAQSPDPMNDLAIGMTLRCLSNYVTVQADGGSKKVKKLNPWMSKAAYEKAVELGQFNSWHDVTTNEHQEPLKEVWTWMLGIHDELTGEMVISRLAAFPFVTVTRDEDAVLRGIRNVSPVERYALANIEVGYASNMWCGPILAQNPHWEARG